MTPVYLSDVLLWAKGLAAGYGYDVAINEAGVWPLAVQGPRAEDLMAELFGNSVRQISFFKFNWLTCNHPLLKGHHFIIARSGYSKQGGFEIYLDEPSLALPLWDALWQAGSRYNVAPGSPNLIERVEGGLLSYGNEITLQNNPLECGMERYCQLDGSIDYIGRQALQQIAIDGPVQKICGVLFDGERCPPCASTWSLFIDNKNMGYITTAIWSPRYNANVALAMVKTEFCRPGTKVEVEIPKDAGARRRGKVTSLPFPAPN